MKTLSRFVAKFTNLIVAVLSCFDRVIFKGYLPITNGPALEGFVDHILKIRRCGFIGAWGLAWGQTGGLACCVGSDRVSS